MVIGTGGPRERRLAAQAAKLLGKEEEPKPKRKYTPKKKEDPAPEYETVEDTEPLSKEEKEAIKEVLDEEDDIGKYD